MANLRTNNLSGEQGQNAYRGSVQFNDADYLQIADSADIEFGSSDYTVEFWAIFTKKTSSTDYEEIVNKGYPFQIYRNTSNDQVALAVDSNTSSYDINTSFGTASRGDWHHIAVSRSGNTTKAFLNGIEGLSSTSNTSIDDVSTAFTIGTYGSSTGSYQFRGVISNVRVVIGTALYTADFTPPTEELKIVDGTAILCCQDSNDPTQEATGKTITGFGDLATAGYLETQPKVISPYGVDAGNTFGGPIQQSSQGYMYFPTGRAEERGRGRGVYGGGGISSPTNPAIISFIDVQSQGNTTTFGNLTSENRTWTHGFGSSTRAIWSNGGDTGGAGSNLSNIIDFVTIATTGDAIDFGDSTISNTWRGGFSNSVRGITGGGGPSAVNTIDFITIANTGDAADFGDLTQARRGVGAMASSTRGVFAGGVTPSYVNIMDFVTIATTAKATDFGDMTQASRHDSGGCSSGTRGIIGGGQTPTAINTIQFITIASTGDASDFGDLQQTQVACGTLDNSIRGVFSGSYTPAMINTMSFITIASTGNSSDFGDNTHANYAMGGTSDSHGGLS